MMTSMYINYIDGIENFYPPSETLVDNFMINMKPLRLCTARILHQD